MTTARALCCAALSLAAVGCGPQQSTEGGTTSALKTPKAPKAATTGLSGSFTVKNDSSCDGAFNIGDPSTIVANATTVTISQNGYTPGEQDVFFTATIGDIITRPDQFDIDHGYTSVDRKIATYSDNDNVFVFKEYLYDMTLTDAEGLAAGPFQTIELDAVSSGVSYDASYSDGSGARCSFVTSH